MSRAGDIAWRYVRSGNRWWCRECGRLVQSRREHNEADHDQP